MDAVNAVPTTTRTELAHRSSAGIDVTLAWVRCDGVDAAIVCVYDGREGAYFEIPAEPYLALDICHHPLAYRDFSSSGDTNRRLAA